jgi:glycosyltransferase involved in cell wall biosynthesis
MNILWIAQRDLHHDLNISTWLEMSKALIKRNHRVNLVTLTTTTAKFPIQITNLMLREIAVIKRFPLVAITFHLQVLIFCLFWLFKIRPDVIITHPMTAYFLLPARLAAKIFRLNTKFILDIRTLPVRSKTISEKIKNIMNYSSIRFANCCFHGIAVITPALQRIIIDQFHVNPHKIGIWMSGVNLEIFQPQNQNSIYNQQSKDRFRVMYHGVLAENRGLMETIQAMISVKELFPQIELFILGKGLAYRQLIESVEQLNLTENVLFHDPVDYSHIANYISQADVGIIPLPDRLCWQVSSPLKLFEYLAMAKPVIVSPIEAHTSILYDCPAAIFLKSTSPEDISESIIKVYKMRNQLNQLGSKGRKFVIEKFTWDHQAFQLEKFAISL